jgi:hypothetical protein
MNPLRGPAVATLLVLGLAAAAAADNVVVQWDNVTLEGVREAHPGPPMVARALAIVHTAIYDAWAAYDPVAVGTRFGGALRQPAAERTTANKEKAISFAAYHAFVDLFPAQKGLADRQLAALGYGLSDASPPALIGTAAARAVLEFRHRDGSNQLGDLHPGAYSDYTNYQPINTADRIIDPTHWQPIHFADGTGGIVTPGYVTPHWGLVTPFALAGGSQFRPGPPAALHSREYVRQSVQVLNLSAGLNDRTKMIAEYWANGPRTELPPGHWCLFAQFVSARDRHSIDQDVKMFFLVGNAVFDAGIACWDAKRAYDYVRPWTTIHYLFANKPVRAWAGPYQGTKVINGASWFPYQPLTFITPPFPEYVSGHSTFSAAAAEVLRRFTGGDAFGGSVTFPPGSSTTEPGMTPRRPVTLRWATFTAAADEAGLSRRYGGIHFEDGDLEGRKLGRKVGAAVWNRAQAYFHGRAD